jgi:hypothetical protein
VPGKADPSSVLSVLEPSDPLSDVEGNVYIFRLTDAQAAHAPSDIAEVKDRIESDVRAGRAYVKAMENAKKLLESTKKDRLPAAAAAAGRAVLPTGFFSKGGGFGPTTIPNYPIESDARDKLVNDAYEKLLAQATPQNPHPVALIELPSEKRVLVAELGDVSSKLRPEQSFRDRLLVALSLKRQQGQDLAAQWFRPDAVKARLGYRSADPEQEKKEKEKENESQNTEEVALD